MPRIRSLKPEFFTSPGTAAVDFPVRIFYQALWCAADDFGIGETNFNALLGLAFPDGDGFSAQDVRRFCADVAQHYGTIFYTVAGRHYYAIPTWDQHQKTERRETRRRFPTPDDPDAAPDQRIYGCADSAPEVPRKNGANSREMPSGTGEQGNRGTGEQGEARTARDRAKRGTRLPDDFTPDPGVVEAMTVERPDIDQRAELVKFVDYWRSQPGAKGRKADWQATYRNWIRNSRPSRAGPASTADLRVAQAQALKLIPGRLELA